MQHRTAVYVLLSPYSLSILLVLLVLTSCPHKWLGHIQLYIVGDHRNLSSIISHLVDETLTESQGKPRERQAGFGCNLGFHYKPLDISVQIVLNLKLSGFLIVGTDLTFQFSIFSKFTTMSWIVTLPPCVVHTVRFVIQPRHGFVTWGLRTSIFSDYLSFIKLPILFALPL